MSLRTSSASAWNTILFRIDPENVHSPESTTSCYARLVEKGKIFMRIPLQNRTALNGVEGRDARFCANFVLAFADIAYNGGMA